MNSFGKNAEDVLAENLAEAETETEIEVKELVTKLAALDHLYHQCI